MDIGLQTLNLVQI